METKQNLNERRLADAWAELQTHANEGTFTFFDGGKRRLHTRISVSGLCGSTQSSRGQRGL